MALTESNIVTKPETKDHELRILIFTATYFVLDGVTLTIRRLESHLRSKGATVKICTTVGDDVDADQIKDVIVVPGIKVPFSNAGSYAIGVGLDANTIRQMEEFKPNCVHFTVPDFVALEGIRWCQKHNIGYIGTWHSNYGDYLKYYFLEWVVGPLLHRYIKGFFEQIPAVYVPTPYMLQRLDEWGYGVATELKEWGRGIDLKLFSPERRSQEFRLAKGFHENDVVVLWVGRIVPEKRPDIWMNVIKQLQAEGHPVQAMVVGNGTYEKTLAQLDRVTCLGWLSGSALAEAYACADILLFPSDVETFGNVTLEALASGCCCVVEKKCGEHLVEHQSNGLLCEAGNYDDFYQATKSIVLDNEMRKRMSINARKSSWKFERNIILQQMLENYKAAIHRHQDPMYIVRRLASSPEAAGRSCLSTVCCNFWLLKSITEPLLLTANRFQNLLINMSDCLIYTRGKMTCINSECNPVVRSIEDGEGNCRFDDERKGKTSTSLILLFMSKIAHVFTMSFSVFIILFISYAAFTV